MAISKFGKVFLASQTSNRDIFVRAVVLAVVVRVAISVNCFRVDHKLMLCFPQQLTGVLQCAIGAAASVQVIVWLLGELFFAAQAENRHFVLGWLVLAVLVRVPVLAVDLFRLLDKLLGGLPVLVGAACHGTMLAAVSLQVAIRCLFEVLFAL
jgi:hypothetical protein